jgi:hypothetical protein
MIAAVKNIRFSSLRAIRSKRGWSGFPSHGDFGDSANTHYITWRSATEIGCTRNLETDAANYIILMLGGAAFIGTYAPTQV